MSDKLGKLREVITERGIFYYRIKRSSLYDDLFLYKKIIKTIKPLFGKPYKKEEYELIPSEHLGGAWWVIKGGNRIENIKDTIEEALNDINDYDPEWDGVMIEDKAKLREILINKLGEDEENLK